ncbi:protein prenyltransferase [Venturia nashicola]|uniref:Protein prenyltransferase n=1 Tax=Venturia nashicola TaxID=86259 RepID=A0A4Z1NE70_9PEZI|nr:protein prenyltransferase [Venturia nashicola]TLD18964.1 protein prenyltransferase [Venturia nashicola]
MEKSQASNSQVDAHNPAYNALERLFSANIDKVLDIEILPSSVQGPDSPLFFEDGLGVGIPKKVLVAAFVKAREIFASRSTDASDQSYQDASRATSIMLLFDPEYLTASSFRKKHILSLSTEDDFQLAAKREMIFLDSVLTSPLHRQSKSPTLWFHRYWLVSLLLRHLNSNDGVSLKHEMTIVFRSAERHQHNYYAWQYARRFISLLELGVEKYERCGVITHVALMEETYKWCERHPSDTSGWSFLLFLMQKSSSDTEYITALLWKTAELAKSFQWNKEALWHFLRTALLMTEVVPENVRTQLIKSTGVKAIGSL